MDDVDDILIEVMDVVAGNDNVSLHTQASTMQVRADDCYTDVDSTSSVDHSDDGITNVDVDANVDVYASNMNISTNVSTDADIACNVASIAKLSQGGKVKER